MKITNREKLLSKSFKRKVDEEYKSKSSNEIAELLKVNKDFLSTEEWFILKAQTIAKYGCTCMRCKRKILNWTSINVDHIKPRKFYPNLSNDPDNLQILCGNCNKLKGNSHDIDYRGTKCQYS